MSGIVATFLAGLTWKKVGTWFAGQAISVLADKGIELVSEIMNDEKNVVEKYVKLQDEKNRLTAAIEANQGAHENFVDFLMSFEGMESALEVLNGKFNTEIHSAEDYWALSDKAYNWLMRNQGSNDDNYSTINMAYDRLYRIQGSQDYYKFSEPSATLTQNTLELATVLLQSSLLKDQFPLLLEAADSLTVDSQDQMLQAVLGAIENALERLETATNDIVTTEQSLSDKIDIMTDNNAMLSVHEGLLEAAIQNIPNTIATMAPIYPVCSCGAGSTAGVSDGVSGETFVDDIVSGVVTGVGRMEVKVNEQVFGEMVDRRNNQNLKNALAGRGFSWV